MKMQMFIVSIAAGYVLHDAWRHFKENNPICIMDLALGIALLWVSYTMVYGA